MKKLLKNLLKFVVLPVVALIAIGALTIWFLSRVPPAEDICNNVHGLVDAEFTSRGIAAPPAAKKEILGPILAGTVEKCIHNVELDLRITARPMRKVAAEYRCLAAAGSLDELETCSR